jgi:hypothetical protein
VAKHGPIHKIVGYPKGDKITDWEGKPIGTIVRKSCKRVRPHERGAWISNERCSYTVKIDGRHYVGRGRGDGISVSLRQRKTLDGNGKPLPPPVYFERKGPPPGVPLVPGMKGARRRKRRR